MTDNLAIENYEIVNDILLVSFTDKSDAMIPLRALREKCPCAACQGEKDALGNIYKGPDPVLTENSFQINGIKTVGYYGLQLFWKDGHDTGIFTGKLLKRLSN
ncbi:MAG: DUF971 domain-containing protein [Candidatus Marinimicrobia bacterium]|nr:DUF971 domain-containing protein [Candidatus Neomarinimicrobiota bacterium]